MSEFRADYPTKEERRLMDDVERMGRALAEEHDKVMTLTAELAEARKLITNNVPHLMTVKLPPNTTPEDLAPEEFHNLSVLQLRAAKVHLLWTTREYGGNRFFPRHNRGTTQSTRREHVIALALLVKVSHLTPIVEVILVLIILLLVEVVCSIILVCLVVI